MSQYWQFGINRQEATMLLEHIRSKMSRLNKDGLGEIHILLFGDFKTAIYQKYAW